jgi:hypothetical protein
MKEFFMKIDSLEGLKIGLIERTVLLEKLKDEEIIMR